MSSNEVEALSMDVSVQKTLTTAVTARLLGTRFPLIPCAPVQAQVDHGNLFKSSGG
ncbi:hypothetical protein BYT27DRAFT_7264712 [Phlegmacium glaucopus]|nr:hypothetical protein BYT27DRAFT_7264712 [Phlegmacium glaucopus]